MLLVEHFLMLGTQWAFHDFITCMTTANIAVWNKSCMALSHGDSKINVYNKD